MLDTEQRYIFTGPWRDRLYRLIELRAMYLVELISLEQYTHEMDKILEQIDASDRRRQP